MHDAAEADSRAKESLSTCENGRLWDCEIEAPRLGNNWKDSCCSLLWLYVSRMCMMQVELLSLILHAEETLSTYDAVRLWDCEVEALDLENSCKHSYYSLI